MAKFVPAEGSGEQWKCGNPWGIAILWEQVEGVLVTSVKPHGPRRGAHSQELLRRGRGPAGLSSMVMASVSQECQTQKEDPGLQVWRHSKWFRAGERN